MRFNMDSDAIVGADSTFDPFYEKNYGRKSTTDQIGQKIPAYTMLEREELNALSYTPYGNFIINLIVDMAFKDVWEHVTDRKSMEPVPKQTMNMISRVEEKYHLIPEMLRAIKTARKYSRSLFFKLDVKEEGKASETIIRVAEILEGDIEYNKKTGKPKTYRPNIRWCKGTKQFKDGIPAENAVLFINKKDPAGNGYQGTPEFLSGYRTVMYEENIAKANAKIITQRGLGLLDITVKKAKSENDLKKWSRKFGNPSQYAAIVHTDRMDVDVKSGMQSGYNMQQQNEYYLNRISAATAAPKNRIIGNQAGAVTGSENDQDNMAQVLRGIQDEWEAMIIKCYKLLEEGLADKKWRLAFPINIKMDREKDTRIFGQEMNALLGGEEIISVKVAEKRLGIEIPSSETEKDWLIADYIADRNSKRAEKYNLQEGETEDEQWEEGGGKEDKKREKEKPEKDSADWRDNLRAWYPRKQDGARFLFTELDNSSIPQINQILKDAYGSGLKTDTLVKIRKEVEGR